MPGPNIHEDIRKGYKETGDAEADSAHREQCLKTIKDNLESGGYKDLNVLYAGNTPLQLVSDGPIYFIEYDLKIAGMLLRHREVKKKKYLNAKNSNGQTALHRAAFQGKVEIAKLLIESGALYLLPDKQLEMAADVVRGRFNKGLGHKLFPQFEKVLRSPKFEKWDAAIQEQNKEVEREWERNREHIEAHEAERTTGKKSNR